MARVEVTTVPNTYDPWRDAWKWSVQGFYANGRMAFQTVHSSDAGKDIEVSAACSREDIELVKVLTWAEAGKPCPEYRRGKRSRA